MVEETQDKAEETPAAPAGPSFLRKTWPLIAFTAGVILFAASIILWRGPIARSKRNATIADVEAGRELYLAGKYREAILRLEPVVNKLWRAPNRRGEVYFLIGSANNILAERASEGEGSEYRRWSLPYLREAKEIGVPSMFALQEAEQLGVSLADVGETNEAISSLEDAVRLRRRMDGVILRRMLQATLRDEPVDPARVDYLAKKWSMIEGLPSLEQRIAAEALALATQKNLADLKETLDDSDVETLATPTPEPLIEIDMHSDLLLTFEGAKPTLEYLQGELENNNHGLSELYRRLSALFASLRPPETARAIEYAKLRLSIEGISVAESDDARRRLAELLLEEGKPVEARAVLSLASDASLPKGVHSYLMGRSYFDEAAEVAASSVDAWLRGDATREKLGRISSDLIRRFRRRDEAGVAASPAWLAWMEPSRLKQLAAQADNIEAAEYFNAVLANREVDDETYLARSLLYLGQVYAKLGRYRSADETFERAVTGFPGTVFDEAARFLRVDAARRAGDGPMLAVLRSAAELAAERRRQVNPYISLDQIRDVFREAWRTYQESGRYEEAIEVARLYFPFASPAAAQQMLAESARDGAGVLVRKSAQENYDAAQATLTRARVLYREAGDNFFAAANADKASAEYTEILWQATLASFEGHDYQATIVRDQDFIAAHAGGPLDFSAHLLLARTRMGLREYPAAKEILETTLARHPRSPNRFEGRMALAQCLVELARQTVLDPADAKTQEARREFYQQAKLTLEKNTDGFDLEPTAADWRRSLFQLGSLLREMGEYDEAISRLDEAIRRYPTASETSDAMYAMAETYLESSKKPAEMAVKDTTLRGRDFYVQERNRRLEKASMIYGALARRIADLQDRRELSPTERILQRNAYFAVGQVFMELEDYPSAINAYTTAASRFQNRPECLGAYLQIANAYWKINKSADALSTLRQAQWVLGQLAPDSFRESALSKEQWVNRLASLVGNAGQGKGSL